MPGLPCADYRAVRLHHIDIASFDPDVLRLVNRLLHNDRRGLHNNRLLNDDRSRSHDNRSGSHNGRSRSRHRACDKPPKKRTADNARGNRTTAARVVVMVVAFVGMIVVASAVGMLVMVLVGMLVLLVMMVFVYHGISYFHDAKIHPPPCNRVAIDTAFLSPLTIRHLLNHLRCIYIKRFPQTTDC